MAPIHARNASRIETVKQITPSDSSTKAQDQGILGSKVHSNHLFASKYRVVFSTVDISVMKHGYSPPLTKAIFATILYMCSLAHDWALDHEVSKMGSLLIHIF